MQFLNCIKVSSHRSSQDEESQTQAKIRFGQRKVKAVILPQWRGWVVHHDFVHWPRLCCDLASKAMAPDDLSGLELWNLASGMTRIAVF
jgi:hypothetical protein